MRLTHRPCTHEEHEGGKWLPVEEFHKKGRNHSGPYKGQIRYDNHCKRCRNMEHRRRYHDKEKHDVRDKNHRKAYLRARSRAFTRLSDLVPELYERLLLEECKREGVIVNPNNLKSKKVG